jgi:predicted branched-subunit amino acid permease
VAVDEMERLFPGSSELIENTATVAWLNEPYTRGSYMALAPGQVTAHWRLCSNRRDVCSSRANMRPPSRDTWKARWKAVNAPRDHPVVMNPKAKQFWAGVRAEIPLLIGVFPFGMIYGALALDAGMSTPAAQMMSSIVFAGSAQFVTTQLVYETAPGFVIVLTIAVVNLRHVLYSASLAPYLASLSTRWKTLLAYLLTDEAYAPTIIKFERDGSLPHGHWFLFGAGLALWTNWQISTALGIFLGAPSPSPGRWISPCR